jgi:hypothetical protein
MAAVVICKPSANRQNRNFGFRNAVGGVAERLKAPVLKTGSG